MTDIASKLEKAAEDAVTHTHIPPTKVALEPPHHAGVELPHTVPEGTVPVGIRTVVDDAALEKGRGLATSCALITDGRFSGGSSGLSVGHISPEAAGGGTLALVRDGDRIRIDIPGRQLVLDVPERSDAVTTYHAIGRSPSPSGGVRSPRDLSRKGRRAWRRPAPGRPERPRRGRPLARDLGDAPRA